MQPTDALVHPEKITANTEPCDPQASVGDVKRILVVEDDPDIRGLLLYNLEREGFAVDEANNGIDGLERALATTYDLIILDLMLPGRSGIEVCKTLRTHDRTRDVPVIMVTAKGEETDIVYGLGVGADDYVVKPFGVKELIARVYTRFRATEPPKIDGGPTSDAVLSHGGIEIDRDRFSVKVDQVTVPMTLAEFRLLEALASRPGIVFTRERLLDHVTGGSVTLVDRNIDVHINAIRKKLGKARNMVETVRGIGYRFKEA